ncbi:MAG TPA: hypothetical protein VF096_01215 [Azonexus sp.]
MTPAPHRSHVSPHAVPLAGRDAARARDGELANFDLRVTLADMTVRETSFTEFLAVLKQSRNSPA